MKYFYGNVGLDKFDKSGIIQHSRHVNTVQKCVDMCGVFELHINIAHKLEYWPNTILVNGKELTWVGSLAGDTSASCWRIVDLWCLWRLFGTARGTHIFCNRAFTLFQ